MRKTMSLLSQLPAPLLTPDSSLPSPVAKATRSWTAAPITAVPVTSWIQSPPDTDHHSSLACRVFLLL